MSCNHEELEWYEECEGCMFWRCGTCFYDIYDDEENNFVMDDEQIDGLLNS